MRTVLVFSNQGSLQYIFLRDTVHVSNAENMIKEIITSTIIELKFQCTTGHNPDIHNFFS
jgi:hypothetical protein